MRAPSYRFAAVALAVSLLPASANAQTYCGGLRPVLKLLTYRDGAVLVQTEWRGDFFQICNLEKPWKGVSTGTCFAWMSKIAAAVTSGAKTGFWYEIAPGSCNALPTYGAAPSPAYVDVSN